MRAQLAEASGEVMGRLSAASMESYSRAYPSLVRLHMLQARACSCCWTQMWILPCMEPLLGTSFVGMQLRMLQHGADSEPCPT